MPVRTDDDQVGTPLCRAIDDALSYIPYLDRGVGFKSDATHAVPRASAEGTATEGRLMGLVRYGRKAEEPPENQGH